MGLDLYAKVEHLLGIEESIQELYDVYLERLKLLQPKRVLDIGCGNGSLAKQIMALGIEVVGIDLSQSMVDMAQEKGVDARCINLHDLEEEFDCAIAVFDVLNYLDEKELTQFLEGVKKVLLPKGKLLADINTEFGFEEIAQGDMNNADKNGFVAISAVYEELKLLTKITYFERIGGMYRKKEGEITQFYHDPKALKKNSPLRLAKNNAICLYSDVADKRLLIFEK